MKDVSPEQIRVAKLKYYNKGTDFMKIELHTITVRELVENYSDNNEGGVTGYNGKLDIRPPYQREFCYSDS